MSYSEKALRRFWSHVNKTDSCWEWDRPYKDGYGLFFADGQRMGAHRFSWILANGPIPDGLLVCHHCDNRCCVNPSHLFLGTHRDNMIDMVKKGRVVERKNWFVGPKAQSSKV